MAKVPVDRTSFDRACHYAQISPLGQAARAEARVLEHDGATSPANLMRREITVWLSFMNS